MRFSKKIESCNLSPIRKFHPYAVEAEAKGRKIYHLNIGQPDIETPREFFAAIQNFHEPVLAYAPSAGIPEYVESVRGYYRSLGIELDTGDILATNGGSEALQIVLQCILDEGDEVLVGALTVKVLFTPGHTPGGVTLLVEGERVLFTGDTLFQGSMGRTDLAGGNYEEIMRSLARLAALEGDYHVLPGHMGGSTLERERKSNYYVMEAVQG